PLALPYSRPDRVLARLPTFPTKVADQIHATSITDPGRRAGTPPSVPRLSLDHELPASGSCRPGTSPGCRQLYPLQAMDGPGVAGVEPRREQDVQGDRLAIPGPGTDL